MKPLRTFVLLLAAVALTGCSLWKEKPLTAWSQATGGEDMERMFWKDLQAKKYAALEQHMSATYVSICADGVRDRAAELERLKRLDLRDYSLGDFQIQPNGSDMTVTYVANVPGAAGPVRMLSVWQQAKHGWIVTAHAEMPAK